MLGLNCLIKDTRAIADIKDAIQIMVGERFADSKPTQFPAIYAQLRKEGLEIDAESAGAIYNELYGGYSDAALSTEEQIIEFSGKDVIDQQRAIVDAMTDTTPAVKENQIGKLSPEKQVATMIAKMFQDANFDGNKNVTSVMKQMEQLVSRAAKSLLPTAIQKPTTGLMENLRNFFDVESVQFETLHGGVNTLETLHSAVKEQVDNYLDEITSQLDDDAATALIEKWNTYVDGFMQSAYDIMLGKSDQNKLLNEALKQVQVDGLQIVDVNDNIKWQVLMEQGNPDTIAQRVKDLFTEGVKDEQGNIQKFSRAEAERIGNYFERLYKNKLASVTQQKIGNNRSKNVSAKNIISDFIKDLGFINLVKDKDGKLLLTQANWKEALESIQKQVGNQSGVDVVVEKLRKFLKEKGLSDSKIDILEKEFRQTVAAKLVPGTATPHALDRLIALKNLNGGKAFEQSTQSALNNVLGVGELDQKILNQLRQIAEVTQRIIGGNNVTGLATDDQTVNRGAYAFQAISQLQRKIKEIIRENNISKHGAQRAVKYVTDVLGASSTSLLLNPGNFGENILTGIASNIGESVLLGVTNPKLFSRLGKAQGDFWNAWASHVSGGVANEVIAEQDITADLQAGERLRLRKWGKEFAKNPVSALLKTPAYAVSIASRTLMNSFDAGFNSAILRKKVVSSIYTSLKGNGLSSSEALKAMDAALNISPEIDAQIDAENKRIASELKSVGITPTAADMALNKRDMRLSLYEDALAKAALMNGVQTTPKQIREATKALIESSSIQTKVLTGKKKIPIGALDVINSAIYTLSSGLLAFQQKGFNIQQKMEQQGRLGAAAGAQFAAEAWKNTVGRFAGGIANFMALAVTATPYGFVTAKSLQNEKNYLLRDKVDSGNIFKAEPGEIRKYAELHNLMRSMVVRASMGTIAIGAFVLSKLMRDDDDEDDNTWVDNLMQTKSGRRLLQKYLPLGINVAAAFVYDVKDKKMDTKMERLIDVLSNTTGTNYDKWSSLKTTLNRAKSGDDFKKALGSYFGSSIPTFNVNQAEQITRFYTTLQSALDEKNISEVKRQEKIASKIYKEAETWVDAIMINGSIDAFSRWFGEGDANRFLKK